MQQNLLFVPFQLDFYFSLNFQQMNSSNDKDVDVTLLLHEDPRETWHFFSETLIKKQLLS